jgi:hypothetical protein
MNKTLRFEIMEFLGEFINELEKSDKALVFPSQKDKRRWIGGLHLIRVALEGNMQIITDKNFLTEEEKAKILGESNDQQDFEL